MLVLAACGGSAASASPTAPAASSVPSAAAGASEVARTLTAPDTAKPGADIVVTWTGKVGNGDYLAVVAAGQPYKDGVYVNIQGTTSATLKAPPTAGAYEIRWIEGDTTDVVKASRPITIAP